MIHLWTEIAYHPPFEPVLYFAGFEGDSPRWASHGFHFQSQLDAQETLSILTTSRHIPLEHLSFVRLSVGRPALSSDS